MTVSDEILKVIEPEYVFVIRFAGIEIGVRDSVIVMWIITIVLIVLARIFVKNLKIVPGKKQNIAETFVETISNFVKSNMGEKHHMEIAPFIGSILLFIAAANIASIFNIIPDPEELYGIFKWDFLKKLPVIRMFPPTKDINVTFGLAVTAVGMVLYKTIKIKKIKGGLRTFIEPVPLILPFKLMDYAVRPLSLTLRMFGNIMAAYIMMELIYIAFPLILPGAMSIYFDIFDGVLQAFIFTFLTTMYMAEALE